MTTKPEPATDQSGVDEPAHQPFTWDVPDRQVTPERIAQLANGYRAAKFVFLGAEVGLFAAAGAEGATVEELAARCGVPARNARTIADALAAVGLLERDGLRYRNAPDAEAFLTGRGHLDMRPMLRVFDQVSYPIWAQAARAARSGERALDRDLTEAELDMYEAAIEITTAAGAASLLETYDFGGHQRVLDAGGGLGGFLAAILTRHAHLGGTLLDVPQVAEKARGRLAASPAAGRAEALGVDFFTDPLPGGYDAVLVAHVVHLFPPERIRALLERLRAATADGGRLLLVDWWLDPDIATMNTYMMAGEFMLTGGGCYTSGEAGEWLPGAGWRLLERRPMTPPMGLLIAETA